MTFLEAITSNGHILYSLPEEKYQFNSEKILGMDLDWTIIKPIKGKIHPLDDKDWEFFSSKLAKIQDKINEGYKFVIFTNQAGLLSGKKNQLNLNQFKSRWVDICHKLQSQYGITSVYLIASLYDDFNRKPCTGMWEFLETQLNGSVKVQRNKCLYIGDMAGRCATPNRLKDDISSFSGRKGDYSSSDLLFALNLGVEFAVPEVFYDDSKELGNRTKRLQERVFADKEIFNGKKYLEEFDKNISRSNEKIREEIKTLLLDKKKQFLIFFIGSPASGKSTYYETHLTKLGLTYLSNDTFNGTPAKFNKEIDRNLKEGKNVIVDNTNASSKTREKLIQIASKNTSVGDSSIQVVCIHVTTPKNIVMHLNALRTKITNRDVLNNVINEGHSVPVVAIHSYWKHLEEPDREKEGIDYVFKIDYEPAFTKTGGITKEQFSMFL
jgi:bifunctional polynucleotide phosphatase/kinase